MGAADFIQVEKDMRQIEQSSEFKAAIQDVVKRFHVLNELEWTMWSKRSHGDIYALVQVSQNLRERGQDVRAAINTARPTGKGVNTMLTRGIGFTLVGLDALIREFGIDTRGRGTEITAKYGAMQERDAANGGFRTQIEI